MLWMNNTGLFSTRCDLVDECTEIMLRMGEGVVAPERPDTVRVLRELR